MPGLQNSKSTLDFLDTIGHSDDSDVLPLSATAKALVDLGAFLIKEATNNLERKANIATGDTASSMKIVNLDLVGPVKSLEVEILDTYVYLDQGVKGVGGVGTGKFQFRTIRPSKKMISAIKPWMLKRGLSGKIKYTAVSKNEAKNQRINKLTSKAKSKEDSLAYAIATSIKKKGIRPTKFFTNAVASMEKRSIDKIGQAVKVDIINSFNRI